MGVSRESGGGVSSRRARGSGGGQVEVRRGSRWGSAGSQVVVIVAGGLGSIWLNSRVGTTNLLGECETDRIRSNKRSLIKNT
eukprot:970851-Pyramimonas_sp.AAC.1